MKSKLIVKALLKFLMGIVFAGCLLFIPASTFKYWNAWLFLGLLFIPMLIFGIILLLKNPELLEKRINSKETENIQKKLLLFSVLIIFLSFIVCGLDFKNNWSNIPTWIITLASFILLISYGIYIEVMRENEYLSRVVEIQENQQVIDTGLYGIVRHPMYFAVIFLFASIPIILGSWYAFFILLFMPIILVIRIINEEKVLENNLNCYKEYKKKVKYRLIPFIW